MLSSSQSASISDLLTKLKNADKDFTKEFELRIGNYEKNSVHGSRFKPGIHNDEWTRILKMDTLFNDKPIVVESSFIALGKQTVLFSF